MPRYLARPLYNEGPGRFRGLRPDDRLVASATELTVEAGTPEAVAELVFATLNGDDRPNARTERSLSVGDVVVLAGPSRPPVALAVEAIGFRRVDPAGSATGPMDGR
jgi:hypothetical protein